MEYQISQEDWEKIYEYQHGLCPICHQPINSFNGEKPSPALDHDHASGLIRGLLHSWCNRLLGYLRDNANLAKGLAAYIENPPAIEALGGARFTAPGRTGTKKRRKLLKKLRASLKTT